MSLDKLQRSLRIKGKEDKNEIDLKTMRNEPVTCSASALLGLFVREPEREDSSEGLSEEARRA